MKIHYAQPIYGEAEIAAVAEALKNPESLVDGVSTQQFEREVATLFGKRAGLMVNSGSSANELAVEALELPSGSEVITPALSFSTTVAPLIRNDLVPVFADVCIDTFVIDVATIEALIGPETRALMIPLLIGNVPDMEALQALADHYDLALIEDSADTLGARFNDKPTGQYSTISTTSFYANHIITAGGTGGMVCVDDHVLERRIRLLRSWGRASSLFSESEASEDRFNVHIDNIRYDRKFVFEAIGHNMLSSEMSAAFGLVQLTRLEKFRARRKKNFQNMIDFFSCYENWLILPRQDQRVDTAWFAFPLVVRDAAPFIRSELQMFLENHHIQTRPIFTGNILRQPGFKKISYRLGPDGLVNTDYIMRQGVLIGCHQGLGAAELDYMFEVFEKFFATCESSMVVSG